MYNYKNSKANIIEILTSKTPIEEKERIPKDQEFTYENGIRSWVGAVFIDIENSTKLFAEKNEKLARLLRAFTSETITIMQDKEDYSQIGIRGDCVYAIYSAPYQADLVSIFNIAYRLNTFVNMFNKIIVNYGYNEINVGIGLGCDQDLIIKAGRSGFGINDKIWIGKAVVDAANLSSVAGRKGISRIAMSSLFYNNIIDTLQKETNKYKDWIKYRSDIFNGIEYYHCDIVQSDFNNWIEGGMKNEY